MECEVMAWLQSHSESMWNCLFLPLSHVSAAGFKSPEAKTTSWQWLNYKQKTSAEPVKLLSPPAHKINFHTNTQNLFCGLSFNIPVHCNVKVFIWLYPNLPVQLSFILERSVGSRKRGPVCPEPCLLRSTKHSAGFKGKCSLGSQVLISLQTDMLLKSLKCQKRWVYLSCWSSWLRMASWAMCLHDPMVTYCTSFTIRLDSKVLYLTCVIVLDDQTELRLRGQAMFISTSIYEVKVDWACAESTSHSR